ncbi:hypothetical protein Syun_018663 [Stephania yunnanensis]|uniref:Uncharacterized protein n=1 Tax=Stephania yunnanensis TaxID=152371 RepID=A0AAP0NYL7_9MAGN
MISNNSFFFCIPSYLTIVFLLQIFISKCQNRKKLWRFSRVPGLGGFLFMEYEDQLTNQLIALPI